MSLPTLRGTGTLLGAPKTGATRTGDPWTSAVIKFQAWKKTDDGWQEGDHVIAACIAFGDAARTLATFAKADSVELRGTCNVGEYAGKPQLKVTVDACRRPVKAGKDKPATTAQPLPAQLRTHYDRNPRAAA